MFQDTAALGSIVENIGRTQDWLANVERYHSKTNLRSFKDSPVQTIVRELKLKLNNVFRIFDKIAALDVSGAEMTRHTKSLSRLAYRSLVDARELCYKLLRDPAAKEKVIANFDQEDVIDETNSDLALIGPEPKASAATILLNTYISLAKCYEEQIKPQYFSCRDLKYPDINIWGIYGEVGEANKQFAIMHSQELIQDLHHNYLLRALEYFLDSQQTIVNAAHSHDDIEKGQVRAHLQRRDRTCILKSSNRASEYQYLRGTALPLRKHLPAEQTVLKKYLQTLETISKQYRDESLLIYLDLESYLYSQAQTNAGFESEPEYKHLGALLDELNEVTCLDYQLDELIEYLTKPYRYSQFVKDTTRMCLRNREIDLGKLTKFLVKFKQVRGHCELSDVDNGLVNGETLDLVSGLSVNDTIDYHSYDLVADLCSQLKIMYAKLDCGIGEEYLQAEAMSFKQKQLLADPDTWMSIQRLKNLATRDRELWRLMTTNNKSMLFANIKFIDLDRIVRDPSNMELDKLISKIQSNFLRRNNFELKDAAKLILIFGIGLAKRGEGERIMSLKV